jgi:hypothetical protein
MHSLLAPVVDASYSPSVDERFGRYGAPVTVRRVLSALALLVVGAAIGVALRPAGGEARSTGRDPIQAFLAAVPRPASGQFPTPQSAVKFLVQQVRAQNYSEAMRVMPITEEYTRATFPLEVAYIQALDFNSFFPGQPVSKFQYAAMRPLFSAYTEFTLLMLLPKLVKNGTMVVLNAAQRKAIEAQLDAKRLSAMKIASMGAPKLMPGRVGKGDGSGVTAQGVLDTVISGAGSNRGVEFYVEKIGTNWFVSGTGTA